MTDPSNLHNSGFGSQRLGLGHAVNHVGGNNPFGGSAAGFRIGGELRLRQNPLHSGSHLMSQTNMVIAYGQLIYRISPWQCYC